ncbi:phage tail protein [Maridesulfovibrio ferrireducens]|uniref:phage tail-collar fiber domain-containing protein n=1 Tax=Maridesulfovibrio ferrireducens TaxID=246191 RepID=UPI001A200FD3|nr:phage tail protein [Maridesulfovibrio ferrireducens]MBI9109915.1 phage tail protein [Maridesulfovibrio ferrireducens]
MSAIITTKGENLIAQCQGEGRVLNIDKMIFANVEGVDPEAAIDRATGKPEAGQIMQEFIIPDEYKGFVNPNQVVYSIVLDSNAGNYDFNWIGLYSSADDVVVAITTLPKISKWKTEGQIQGNHLTRNFMLEFTGAAESTGMNVAADTWQLDFSVRLNGIDDRQRKSNRDTYGRARFWKDGFKLVNAEGAFTLSAGVGYVEGIRIDLENVLPVSGENLPKSVWLDVSYTLQGSDVVAKAVPVYGDDFEDSILDGINHYFVKIAEIDGSGTVTDCRTVDNIETDLVEYLKNLISGHGADPNAHMELLARLATGIVVIMNPLQAAVDIGETPVFSSNEFVPIFINTVQNAAQWQVDYASGDFSNPVFDSGPSAVALTSFEMPAGYLQVSNIYKVRCRRRLNTGQWSPWSEIVIFTTRSVFNYVARPVNLEPVNNAIGIQERPVLKSGPFSVAGDAEDTHAATQFRIRIGDTVLHVSPEILAGFEYILPAGLLLVSSDYILECRHRGANLDWSEWSLATTFRTVAAFMVGDEAVYPSAWDIVSKASSVGMALEDGAELCSNGIDQDEGDGDWGEISVRAKVRDKGLNILDSTSKDQLDTTSRINQEDLVATGLGLATVGVVTTSVAARLDDPDPFNDSSGLALYQFNGNGTNLGTHGGTWEGVMSYVGGNFGTALCTPGNYASQANGFSITADHSFSYWSTSGTGFGIIEGYLHSHIGLASNYIFGWFDSPQHQGTAGGLLPADIQNQLAAIFSGGWHHICLVPILDGVQLWIDNNLIYTRGTSAQPELIVSALQSQYGSSANQYYDQVRVFKRSLSDVEIQRLFAEECTVYHGDISAANFPTAPNRAHKLPALTAATGAAGTAFTADNFTEITIEKITLGTDTDPDNPNFLLLESIKLSGVPFRCVAMGVKNLPAGSECRVAETRIDTYKLG